MLSYVLSMLVSLGWLTMPQPGLAWAFGLVGQYWSRPRAQCFFVRNDGRSGSVGGGVGSVGGGVGGYVKEMIEAGVEEIITESGFGLYFGDLNGKEMIFEAWLNRKQYIKVLKMLSGDKPFVVFEKKGYKFVMHHGNPSGALPEGVDKYVNENGEVYILSCFGASHPYKGRHVCPVNAPLWVSVPIEANVMGTLCPVAARKGGYKLSISVESKLIQH